MHSQHESIKFNFELKFNLEEFRQKEISSVREEILSLNINSFDVHQIVQAYLYFHGYYETLTSFEKITELPRENTTIISTISAIVPKENHVLNGNNGILLEEEIKTEEEIKNEEEIMEEFKENKENIEEKQKMNLEEFKENCKRISLEEKTRQKDRDCK